MNTTNKTRLKISKSKATRLRSAIKTPASSSPETKAKEQFRALIEEFEPHNNSRLLREVRVNVMFRELQKAYQEIKDQHQLILNIIESLPSTIVITEGPDHRVVMLNQFASQILDSRLLGRSWKKVIEENNPDMKPGDYPITIYALDAAYQTGQYQKLSDYNYKGPGSKTYTWEVYFFPLFTEDKRVKGVLCYGVETTQLVNLRREAEQNLQQKQQLLLQVEEQRRTFNSLVESISDGLFLIGPDQNIVFVNQRMANLLSINPVEVERQPFLTVLRQIVANVSSIEPQIAEQQLVEAMSSSGNSAASLEFSYKLPENEQVLDLRFSFFEVTDAQGQLVGQGCLVSDITRQKEVDRLKTQFISTVSHEMRTPLTGIFGYLELLLYRKPNETLSADWLNRIYQEVFNLNKLLDELLDLSRIEAGRLELHKERVQLENLVREVLVSVERMTNSAKAGYPETQVKKHEIQLEIEGELPLVNADRTKITRVFNNLIQNAIKYSPNGGLIQIKLKRQDNQILVSVSDEGLGIAEEEQAKIFNRFYRTRESQQRKIRGNGLGLSIVKSIVELHQGAVWLESSPEQGSTFYFTLPIN